MKHLKTMGEDPSAVFIGTDEKKKSQPQGDLIRDPSPEEQSKSDESAAGASKPRVRFTLPDEVLPSATENKIGLLNLAAESLGSFDPNIDPDIREVLYALEDEEYVEDELEDDFFGALGADEVPEQYQDMVKIAEEQVGEWEKEHQMYSKKSGEGEDYSDYEYSDDEWEDDRRTSYAKTSFSMTSSAMFRNQQLTLLDDRFDKVLEDYSDTEEEDVEGELSTEQLQDMLDAFLEETETIGQKRRVIPKRDTLSEMDDEKRKEIEVMLERMAIADEKAQPEENDRVELDERPRETWDVETILSTYSNIYNRPKILSMATQGVTKIRLKGRNKMPTIEEDHASSTSESGEEDDSGER